MHRGQSKKHSWLEAVVNVLVGYWVAVAGQVIIFPLFGVHISLQQDMLIGLFFTAISLVRSYLLRRAFNAWHVRQQENCIQPRYMTTTMPPKPLNVKYVDYQAPIYVLCPGWVRSKHDGHQHFIDSFDLAQLYGVVHSACLIINENSRGFREMPHHVMLRPRDDGDYRLPHLRELDLAG